MPQLKSLSPHVSAGPQIQPGDLKAVSDAGFTSVINNRPDDEEPGQPSSAEIQAAARVMGMNYLHVPVRGMPDGPAVAAVASQLKADATNGTRTVMFCRSGMRSAASWAMAQRLDGVEADILREAAAAAGYDLSRLPL